MELTDPKEIVKFSDYQLAEFYSKVQNTEKVLADLKLAINAEVTLRMEKEGKTKWHLPELHKSFIKSKRNSTEIDIVELVDRLPDAVAYLSISKENFKTIKELYPEEDLDGLEIEKEGKEYLKMIDDTESSKTSDAMEKRILASVNQTTKVING